jgi:hypothetical protein
MHRRGVTILNVAFGSPTDDAEIGTEEPENRSRFGSIEIRNFQTAGRMTNRWPGIKGATPARRQNAVAKWARQADAVCHHLPVRSGKSYPEFCKWRAGRLWSRARPGGPPRLRRHYPENDYGAFILDPDGHNIEAVCHRKQA